MFCLYAYTDGGGQVHKLAVPQCASTLEAIVAQGIRYYGTKQLDIRSDEATPELVPQFSAPRLDSAPPSNPGWGVALLNRVEQLLPSPVGPVPTRNLVPTVDPLPPVGMPEPNPPTGTARGYSFPAPVGPVPTPKPSPVLVPISDPLGPVGMPEPNPPTGWRDGLPDYPADGPKLDLPGPKPPPPAMMPEQNPPKGWFLVDPTKPFNPTSNPAIVPAPELLLPREQGPRKGFFLEDPTKPFDPLLNPDTVPMASDPRPPTVEAPPAAPKTGRPGLAGPDLTTYDKAGLRELCNRYGDSAACAYLASLEGLPSTPEDNLDHGSTADPKPPANPTTPTTPTPSDNPMAGTNSDGTSTAPDLTDKGTDLNWFVENRDKILGVVGGLASIFVPGNSTAPAPTAASPGPNDKPVPWYKTVPWWVWVLVAAVGSYTIARKSR